MSDVAQPEPDMETGGADEELELSELEPTEWDTSDEYESPEPAPDDDASADPDG